MSLISSKNEIFSHPKTACRLVLELRCYAKNSLPYKKSGFSKGVLSIDAFTPTKKRNLTVKPHFFNSNLISATQLISVQLTFQFSGHLGFTVCPSQTDFAPRDNSALIKFLSVPHAKSTKKRVLHGVSFFLFLSK